MALQRLILLVPSLAAAVELPRRLASLGTALAGVYPFRVTQDGKVQDIHARYTYVYQKVGGEWKILNHHSSAMPEIAAK